jgi:tetratricopeptide (TPR) repeat protein
VLVLHGEALMTLQPWDYWEADGLTPKGEGEAIVDVLERALELEPGHPGAAHLYIHAMEASAEPGRAEAAADALRGAAPAAGHLAHMPAHIYARVGRHADSIAVNREAIAADEVFLAQARDAATPLWRFGYYPHNVHYLMVSAQMAGLADEVIPAAEKLAAITSAEVSHELAWVQAIMTAPYTAHAQFSDPETILALPAPAADFPFVAGFAHYARGLAQARAGAAEAAEVEAAAIDRLIETADMSRLEAQFLPARDLLAIARDVVLARAAAAQGDLATAEELLRAAVTLEEGIGYMEPPYWYYPVRQTLGAVLLKQGRAEEAAAEFEAALARMPRNGWALWGLLKAERAAGRDTESTEEAFAKTWLGDHALLSLDRL